MERSTVLATMAHNLTVFQSMVKVASQAKSENRRIHLATQAAIFATHYPIGRLNSKTLEDILTTIAAQHTAPLAPTFKPNSVLHIMTRSYASGGHTRVCERWINASPATETHSLALISQGTRPVPELLNSSIQHKHGEVLHLSGTPLEKALALRAYASQFEHIVLHVHMYDPVPLLAFGTQNFPRPIMFYNHADHSFWLGCSIIDQIINLRTFSTEMNSTRRGIAHSKVLPLPVNAPPAQPSPAEITALRTQLNLPTHAKVIITIARPYKFAPFNGLDFIAMAEDILQQNPNAYLLAIGPSMANPMWQQASQRTNGRIQPLGVIPNHQLGKYLALADLALESFPLGSPTALLDVARTNVPCLSLNTPTNAYDAFAQAGIVCATPADMTTRATAILSQPKAESPLFQILQTESFPEGFAQKLAALKPSFPTQHTLHPVTEDTAKTPSEFEIFNAYSMTLDARTPKSRAIYAARRAIYYYVRFLFPLGLTRKAHNTLAQYGLI